MRVVVITMGFGNIQVLTRSFEMITETSVMGNTWYVLNQHYPLPSHKEFQEGLIALSEKYNFTLFDEGKNLGLSAGLNYLIDKLNNDDIVIGLDPDSLPATVGWDLAMVDLFKDPTIVWTSLANAHSFGEMSERGFSTEMNNGYKIRVPHKPVVNSICAWRVSWLRSNGGIKEPNKYYGGLECATWRKVDQKNKRWVFLEHYWEHSTPDFPIIVDEKYTRYKFDHAHKGDPRSFDEWLGDENKNIDLV